MEAISKMYIRDSPQVDFSSVGVSFFIFVFSYLSCFRDILFRHQPPGLMVL